MKTHWLRPPARGPSRAPPYQAPHHCTEHCTTAPSIAALYRALHHCLEPRTFVPSTAPLYRIRTPGSVSGCPARLGSRRPRRQAAAATLPGRGRNHCKKRRATVPPHVLQRPRAAEAEPGSRPRFEVRWPVQCFCSGPMQWPVQWPAQWVCGGPAPGYSGSTPAPRGTPNYNLQWPAQWFCSSPVQWPVQ